MITITMEREGSNSYRWALCRTHGGEIVESWKRHSTRKHVNRDIRNGFTAMSQRAYGDHVREDLLDELQTRIAFSLDLPEGEVFRTSETDLYRGIRLLKEKLKTWGKE